MGTGWSARRTEYLKGHKQALLATVDAIELIDWYRARWEIEILFNILKNGCQVEELQLGMFERLAGALALFLVVAWRVAHLMRLGRTCPDLDAHLFFEDRKSVV